MHSLSATLLIFQKDLTKRSTGGASHLDVSSRLLAGFARPSSALTLTVGLMFLKIDIDNQQDGGVNELRRFLTSA